MPEGHAWGQACPRALQLQFRPKERCMHKSPHACACTYVYARHACACTYESLVSEVKECKKKAPRPKIKKRWGTPSDPFSREPIGERTVRSPMGRCFFGPRGVPLFLRVPRTGLAIGAAMGQRLRHAPMSLPREPARGPLPWEPGSGSGPWSPGPGRRAPGPSPGLRAPAIGSRAPGSRLGPGPKAQAQGPKPKGPKPEGPLRASVTRFLSARYV